MYQQSENFKMNIDIEMDNQPTYQVAYANFVLVQKAPMSPPMTSSDSAQLSLSKRSQPSQPGDRVQQPPPFQKIKARRCHKSVGPVRPRIAFTLDQIDYLEYEFRKCVLLEKTRRFEIAQRLGLQERHVTVWFQNRRIKLKKETLKAREQKFDQFHQPCLPEFLADSSNIEAGIPMYQITYNSSAKVAQKVPLLRVRTVEEINEAIGRGLTFWS